MIAVYIYTKISIVVVRIFNVDGWTENAGPAENVGPIIPECQKVEMHVLLSVMQKPATSYHVP